MNIYTLFPVEILVHDVGSTEQQWIREQVEPIFDQLDFHSDQARHMVKTTYQNTVINDIIDHNIMALSQVIMEATEYYLSRLNSTESLSMFESWFNIYERGGYMSDHEHPGCVISGIYYYQAEEGSGDLWFRNPNPLMLNHIWPGSAQPTLATERVPARTGRLVLFPGWLTHSVSTCLGSKISIPFNLR